MNRNLDHNRPTAPLLKGLTSYILIASLLALLAACGEKEESTPTQEETTLTVSKVKPAEIIATIDGLEITRPLLQIYSLNITDQPYKNINILTDTKDLLEPIIEELALAIEVGKRIQETDNPWLAKTEQDKALTNTNLLLSSYLYTEEILGKITPPTDEQIKTFYENNTEEIKIPFLFDMRQIVVYTYQEVTTTKTTTLAGLAERLSGDVRMADRILINNADRQVRAPDWNTKDKDLTTKPLQPGENLLVPLSDELKKAPHAKILALKARLDAGEDFLSVAKDAAPDSGLTVTNLPETGRSLLPQYLEAAHKTKAGEISEIFQTKHGYHIMEMLKKQEERIPPMEEVSDLIRRGRALTTLERNEKRKAYTNALFHNIDELKVQYDLLKDPELDPNTVVVTLGNKSYTKAQLGIEVLGEAGPDTSNEAILTALMTQKDIIPQIESFQARRLGLYKNPKFIMQAAGQIYQPLLAQYNKTMLARQNAKKIPDAEVKAYYEAHKEEFNIEKVFNCHILLIRDTDAAKTNEAILSAIKNVKTLEDFKKVIREKSSDPRLKQVEGFQKIQDSPGLPASMRTELNSLPLNQMSQPIYIEAWKSAMVFWLLNIDPKRPATFEQSKVAASQKIMLDRQKTYPEELREEMLKEAKLVMR